MEDRIPADHPLRAIQALVNPILAAQNIHEKRPSSAVDGRTTRHPGFDVSQVKRKLVEEGVGWEKTIGGLRKLHHRGTEKVAWIFSFTNAAYNLVRMRTLIRAGACA